VLGIKQVKEMLAILYGAAGYLAGRARRGKSVQYPLPIFVGVCVRYRRRHSTASFPRVGTGRFPKGRVTGKLRDAVVLFGGKPHANRIATRDICGKQASRAFLRLGVHR